MILRHRHLSAMTRMITTFSEGTRSYPGSLHGERWYGNAVDDLEAANECAMRTIRHVCM